MIKISTRDNNLFIKLAKYGDYSNVYVHYSDLPKIGINPNHKWEDPMAIFMTPIELENKNPMKRKRYRFEVKFTGNKVFDISDISQEEAIEFLKKLAEIQGKELSQDIIDSIKKSSNWGGLWWDIL